MANSNRDWGRVLNFDISYFHHLITNHPITAPFIRRNEKEKWGRRELKESVADP